MQLLLFGYAINTKPRDLPTAVLLQESSDVGRSILKALENTRYFKVTRQVRRRSRIRSACWPRARCCSRSRFRADFERAVRRGDKPALLVAADATDPVATGAALGALNSRADRAAHDRGLPDSGAPLFEIRTHARYNPAARASSTSCRAWSARS